jgi:hypothetical protein
MTEFETVILAIMGVCTVSVFLNAYLAHRISVIECENEELKQELCILQRGVLNA